MGEALNVDWNAIREAAIAGVPFKVLAAQFGIIGKDGKPSTGAIRIRALRERWPVVTRLVSQAKREAREASRKLEEARKIRAQYLNSSQAKPTDVTLEPIREEAGMGDIEPGFGELGDMTGIRNQGSREAGIRGNGASILASKAPKERDSGEGAKGLLSIGKVGNQDTGRERETSIVYRDGRELGKDASQSLQGSESTAATLIQQHMHQLAQESIIQALTRAHASIHAAPSQLPIATITDLRSAAKLAMELTGMDKTTNNTQLNILVSPTPKAGSWNFHDSPELPIIDT
jgi:hypothetical protein